VEYTFDETLNLSAAGTYQVTVTLNITGDEVPTNNSKTVQVINTVIIGIDVFPYMEGFEKNGNLIPDGWTQEHVIGTTNWGFGKSNQTSTQPATVHSGEYKAYVYISTSALSGNRTKLVMPEFNLSALSNPVLKFWHTQRGDSKLRVYYKTSAAGAWTLLGEYLSYVSDWRERVVALVNPSATYYIAFESEITLGYGIQLDDVSVSAPVEIDGELTAIIQPVSGFNLTNAEPVKVSIRNNGANALSNFGIELKLGANVVATETYTGTIASDAEVEYTFNETLDLSTAGTYQVTVTLNITGDESPGNNAKTVVVVNTLTTGEGVVNVTLAAGDVWGDGSGFQMLLDSTATGYGSLFPVQGFSTLASCGVVGLYEQFSRKIPYNADSNCATSNMVVNDSVTVQIPAGIYDFVVCNPRTSTGLIQIPTVGSYSSVNDFNFQSGNDYTFTVSRVYEGGPAHVTMNQQPTNVNLPRMVTNLTATQVQEDALFVAISWTNPSLTVLGAELTDFTAVKVYVGNETTPIHTISNPVPGANELFTFTVPASGFHTFKVIPENTAGQGTPHSVTKWITTDVVISTFPWIEEFETTTFPRYGWNRQIMQGTTTWERNTLTTNNHFVYEGEASAYHASGNAADGMQESWLVTPKIVLPSTGSYKLAFWSVFDNHTNAGIHQVLISTTGNNPAVNAFVLLKNIEPQETLNGIWNEITIYLNDYLGQEVYIAFKYGATAGPRWFIDNVMITAVYGIDAAAEKIYGPVSAMVNLPFKIKAVVKNAGSVVLSDYMVVLTDNQGNPLTGNYTGPALNPGEKAIIEMIWTPVTSGSQQIRAKITTPGDGVPANNISPYITVNVLPQSDTFTLRVGNGSYTNNNIPFCMWYSTSRAQSIYYDHELINKPGIITKMQYFNSFTTTGGVNIPIKIWMLNTDRTELDTWHLPLSDFLLVFEGNVHFPQGNNTVTINLDIPFIYTGQNLLVMSDRIYTEEYFGMSNIFTCTQSPDFPNRSRYLYNAYDVNWDMLQFIGYGTGINQNPNTNFIFPLNVSSIAGTVTDGATPVSGVSIEIEGSPHIKAVTDANGSYSFDVLMPGNYKLQLSKHGYFDITTETITLASNENAEFDIVMPPLPRYTVSGKVVGSNAPNGIANITVKLSGYDSFSATTNVTGDYTMPNVYGEKLYTIEAKATGYDPYFSNINVINDVTRNILLNEIAYHAVDPVAEIAGENVEISWLNPGTWVPRTYILDDGTAEIGTAWPEEVANHSSGNLFEVNETGEIISVDVYGVRAEGATGRPQTIRIYNEKRELVGESEEFVLPADNWINVPLDNIPYSGTFYAMLFCPRPNSGRPHFLGLDQNGPYSQYDHIAWTCQYGFWYNYNEFYRPGIFMIRVNATSTGKSVTYGTTSTTIESDKNEIELTNEIMTDKHSIAPLIDYSTSRVFENYSVYRLTPGQPEGTWTLLSDDVTESPYTDTQWGSLPQDTYLWAVKVHYTNNVVSEPRFTNTLQRTPYSVTFNIFNSQTQQPITGATVVFNGVTLGSYVAQNVLPGKYPYSVSKEEFATITGEVTVVNQNVTVPIALTPLSIGELNIANIQLYPNPFNNEIYISHPELVKNVQITNVMGQIIEKITFNGKYIATENLCSGIYFVTLETITSEKTIFKMVRK
jgi:hypothetical protein